MPTASRQRVALHGGPPAYAEEWAILYESGYTFRRIAATSTRGVGPDTVRRVIQKWWPDLTRRTGPNGGSSLNPLVRMAKLEDRMKALEGSVGLLMRHYEDELDTLRKRVSRAEDAVRETLDTTR